MLVFLNNIIDGCATHQAVRNFILLLILMWEFLFFYYAVLYNFMTNLNGFYVFLLDIVYFALNIHTFIPAGITCD